jgi:thiol:disulfide interchange protein DsbD
LVVTGLIWPPVNLAGMSGTMTAHPAEKIAWRTELDGALQDARTSGKPVLIDTWATWCANCRRLDRETWSDDAVAAEAKRYVGIKLQLETNDAPQTRQFLSRFSLKQYSLPTIILLDSSGGVRDVIFGFVDAGEMLTRLRAVQ